jgi:hypothetical protein
MVFSKIKTGLQKVVDRAVASNPVGAQKFVDVGHKVVTAITAPIASIKDFSKAQQTQAEKSSGRLVYETTRNVGLVGGAVLAPAVFGAKATATAVGKTLLGTPKKALITTASAGALVASPTLRSAVTELPVTTFKVGEKVGQAIEGSPLGEKSSDLLAKGMVAGGVGALALGAGLLVAPKVKDFIDSKKTDPSPKEQIIKTDEGIAPSQEVETIKAGDPEIKAKGKREGVRVSQRVDVRVNNSNRKIYKGIVIK